MTLFFETSGQIGFFLAALPLGFLIALSLDCELSNWILRLCFDLMLLLLCALGIILLLLCFRDTTLRLYHLLGVLAGAIIYIEGVGKIRRKWKNAKTTRSSRKLQTDEEIIRTDI